MGRLAPLPEMLCTSERDGRYFAVVRLERETEQQCFRFGVTQDGYAALNRILHERPFDQMPGLRHHYFFAGARARLDHQRAEMAVRVTVGKDKKQMTVEAPFDLVANLVWFERLEDWAEAGHLLVPDPRLS
jgi:hypothetical protein